MEDWRFRQCPYLERGGLYAYAGVPLRLKTESGHTVGLGSLCVASSKSEEPLTKAQHQALVRLGDWVVSDLVQCTRARRQRERHRMSKLLAKAKKETNKAATAEPVFEILKTIYPEAIIRLRPSRSSHVEFEGCDPIPVTDLKDGLWEDVQYIDEFITNSNHLPTPSDKPVRIVAVPCESTSGSSLLIVATRDFHLIFDDADAWFIQACADIMSQKWRKSLLAEAMIAKEKFLRAFSHQLRTPVHGILAAVELLTEEMKSKSWGESTNSLSTIKKLNVESEINPPEPFTYLNIIKMAGRDLTSIINNLIALNKWSDIAMANRHYSMHTLDELETEIANEINMFTMGDTRYKCSIFFAQNSSPDCGKFSIDLGVLRDTLLPLVVNSIQQTPQGIVSITVSIQSDFKQLVVDVEDTGRGIHPDDQQRIFEAYEKVDLHSSGAGLGLILATKFASLIHGSIELVSSEIGRGSHFRATFREVEFDFSSQPPQPLSVKFDSLPSRFFKEPADSDSLSLGDHFTSFLLRNGFTCSDTVEDCLVIVETGSDPEQHRACLSQISPEQVAICLVPIPEEKNYLQQPDDNLIYVNGPFRTSTFYSALERAHTYLKKQSSKQHRQQLDTLDKPIIMPATTQKSSTTEEYPNTHPPTVISNQPIATATIPPVSQPDAPVSLDLNMTALILTPPETPPQPVTLIVDDNAVNLRVMETYCTKRGLPYLSAMNGRQATELFSQRQTQCPEEEDPPIQLIFMDLQMPVCGGIEATQQIRALEQRHKWKKSFLFVMTGQDSPADRKAAEEAGADEYFVKPVIPKQLDRVVKQYFPAFDKG